MKTILLISLSLLCATNIMAQTEMPDSIKTQNLNEVVVEGQLQTVKPAVSTICQETIRKNLHKMP